MSHLGRAVAMSGLLMVAVDRAEREHRAADEWRRLHRRPDAEPLDGPIAGARPTLARAGIRARLGALAGRSPAQRAERAG